MIASSLDERTVRDVEQLLYDYADAIDEDVDRWPSLFTADAIYKVTSRENDERNLPLGAIYCEGRGMILDRAMAVRSTTVYAPRTMRHTICNVRVSDLGDGAIGARSNFVIYETFDDTVTRLFAVGKYRDVIAREGDRLLFREKVAVIDSNLVVGSLVYPI